MTEALLCTEQLASADEERRHTVAQPVQRRPMDPGVPGELGKPVAECACGQPDVVVGRRGEEPRSQLNAIGKTAGPAFGTRSPQLDRLTPEGETAGATGLGRPKHIGRDASLDTEHAVLEIVEAQRHQLPAPSARVRGQTDEQADLLSLVPTLGVPRIRSNDERLGRVK